MYKLLLISAMSLMLVSYAPRSKAHKTTRAPVKYTQKTSIKSVPKNLYTSKDGDTCGYDPKRDSKGNCYASFSGHKLKVKKGCCE
jgi:hypothetical protein